MSYRIEHIKEYATLDIALFLLSLAIFLFIWLSWRFSSLEEKLIDFEFNSSPEVI